MVAAPATALEAVAPRTATELGAAWPAPTVRLVEGLFADQLGLSPAHAATTSSPEVSGWLLVRPDGYAAARGRDRVELDRALAQLAR